MVPRSLAVAIAVGAASGAAAALALHDVRALQDGPFRLEPGSERYAPGSPVDLVLTNGSDGPLPLGRLEVSGLAGMPIYGRELGGVLGPGGSVDIEWDQTDSGGGQVFAGIYKARAGEPPASAVVEIAEAGLQRAGG